MRRILLPMILIFIWAFGKTAVPAQPGRVFQIKTHNINQVEMSISNYGKFGQDEAGNAGLWWPKGSDENYVFGAGPWFGVIETATGDTLVTIGYGPHGGESEYAPGLDGMSMSAPEAVLYMMPDPWPPPAASYPMAPQESKSHQDSWCAYNDLDGTRHMPGDTRPIGLEVYQTVYAWNLNSTQDIIFVRYELKNVSGARLTNCYFGVCTDNDIGNESGTGNDVISAILSHTYVLEGDTFLVDNLGYQWQNVEEATWSQFPGAIGFDYLQSPWDLPTSAIPFVDKDGDGINDFYEMDSGYFFTSVPESLWDADGDGTPDWRDPSQIPQMGMTAFKRFTLNLEPNVDWERYVTLEGKNFKTLAYEPYDTIPPQPDDQRFLQCSGPFNLGTDSIAVVLVGIVLANWHDIYGTPDSALAKVDATAQYIYNMNWLLPGPPPPPMLTCLAGDAKVTLTWDAAPEITPDPYYAIVSQPGTQLYDPFYREYDFEGYGVWKSNTGNAGTWDLLTRYDVFNDITFDNPTQNDSVRLYANNSGIKHSYVDTDVRNGFTYYYAITSYDYNKVKGVFDSVYIDTFYVDPGTNDTTWDYDTVQVYGGAPIMFESGAVGIATAARRDAANYVAPGIPLIEVLSGNERLADLVQAAPVNPLIIDPSRPSYLDFFNPETVTVTGFVIDTLGDTTFANVDGVKYVVNLRDADSVIMTTMVSKNVIGKSLRFDELPEVDGIAATIRNGTDSFPSAVSFFDTVEIAGTYPFALLGFSSSTVPNASGSPYCRGFWAYRGNDYQVTWKKKNPSGPVNTVEVKDINTGEVLSYRPFQNNAATRHLGEGWCFAATTSFTTVWLYPGTDTLAPFPPNAARTKSLYINGGLISLRSGQAVLDTLRPSENDVWTVRANQEYSAAPVYGTVKISGTPGYFDTVATLKLNVKVVPNPYIVQNEWQVNVDLRRLKFINLPNDCTIRIFNLNGELVKTLLHHETITTGAIQNVPNNAGGDEWWDLLSDNRQLIANGVYIFHIESKVGAQVGKFVVIR